ncbi:MAG: response regulator [Deltaproteobacteria bacterium]|nr:response regulator [Deltaproteobacteria bacterium]
MESRILVVDDEKEILDTLAEFMADLGYQADFADAVDAALVLMKKNEYDVFLLDKNMPDNKNNKEGGMSLLRYAKENMPGTEVIMMTGYGTVESAVEAMKLGAFDYITKPISLKDVKLKIDRILDYKRFINSEDTLRTYKILHNQLLSSLVNLDNLPEDQLEKILRTLGARIDQVFGLQKDYETIIEAQADALEKIQEYVEHLKEAVPTESPYYVLIDKIIEASNKRITARQDT